MTNDPTVQAILHRCRELILDIEAILRGIERRQVRSWRCPDRGVKLGALEQEAQDLLYGPVPPLPRRKPYRTIKIKDWKNQERD